MEAYAPFLYQRRKDYGSAKKYTEEVSKWLYAQKKANEYQNKAHQIAHQNAYNAMMMNINANQQAVTQAVTNLFGVAQDAVNLNIQRQRDRHWLRRQLWRTDGDPRITENVHIASYSKRLLAELLDFFIFFFIKLGLLFIIVEMGYIDIQEYEKFLTDEIDIQNLLDLSQGLLPADLVCKFISSIVEAIMISFGIYFLPRGCTPGKYVMRIKIIDCVTIQPNQDIQGAFVVTRTENVSLVKALSRSFIKNFVISFFYPISCAAYVFSYNRAIYDVVAKTLVVQM
uniref:RDD domain-containing protein n=1 Tax=Parastrongyloides trichosuri TaxID=131310 RepID=A0A0N4Z0Z0_PARTI